MTDLKTSSGLATSATAIFYAASFATAIIFLWHNAWWGSRDFPAFIFWSIPYSVLIYQIVRQIDIRTGDHMVIRYMLVTLLSIAASFLWTCIVGFILGGAFYAFSFSILFCWITGTATAFFFSVVFRYPRSLIVGLGMLGLICTGGWYMIAAASSAARYDLLVTINPDASENDINTLYYNVIGYPSPKGEGYKLLGAISAVGRVDTRGNARLLVSLHSWLSDSDREQIRQHIAASPLVIDVKEMPATGSPDRDEFTGQYWFRGKKTK
jgi:hypothetical protein